MFCFLFYSLVRKKGLLGLVRFLCDVKIVGKILRLMLEFFLTFSYVFAKILK